MNKALALLTGEPVLGRPETAADTYGSILAVRITGSVIGEYWFCLSEDEPFDPDDGLPIYRPSEIRHLKAQGYSEESLKALHAVKVALHGTIRGTTER